LREKNASSALRNVTRRPFGKKYRDLERSRNVPSGNDMRSEETDRIFQALEVFRIEIPCWGFANGSRFGRFTQAAAATTPEEKFSDASQVYVTGVCPTVALHILWDLPEGIQSAETVNKLAERYSIRPGSINPNLFQDQAYKYGSFG
jgi:L-rhamnose isomerase/sugar isomerase